MRDVGSLMQYVGGAIGRVAGTGLLAGTFTVIAGFTPAEAVAYVLRNPPAWLESAWFRPALIIVGLAIIAFSLSFNRWSQRQKAIDSLAEDNSWAIHDLVNRKARPQEDQSAEKFKRDYDAWCAKVSKKLENRAFFTRADQLHFDRLGFVDSVQMTGDKDLDWLLSQLRLKIERLREIINWTQERRR